MLGSRIAPVFDGTHIPGNGFERRRAVRLKVTYKLWRPALGNIENVVQHEDLAVNVGSCADTDYGNRKRPGNERANFVRNALQQDDVSARILQPFCGLQHFVGLVRLAALHLEAANLVHRLWLESKVRTYRNVVARQMLYN